MTQGFIKLHRQILEWEWYKDANTMRLFLHFLLKANHKEKKWQGHTINKGSFITSLDNLVIETGLSKMQIRTAIKKLKLTHEITHETTRSFSIITINNWEQYQDNNTQDNIEITHKQHTDNTPITLTNNDKNDKNIVIGENKKFQIPAIEEIKNYCTERNNKVDANRFYDYYQSKGWMIGKNKMKDWKAAVRTWERKESLTVLSSNINEGSYNCGF